MNALYERTRELKRNLKLAAVSATILVGIIANPNHAHAGGVDGGGGNGIDSGQYNSVDDLEIHVQSMSKIIKYKLNFLEFVAVVGTSPNKYGSTPLMKANSKLFRKRENGPGSRPEVFQVLEKVDYLVLPTGPCWDSSEGAVDASSEFSAPGKRLGPNQICLSFERLSAKYDRQSGATEIPNLIVHELAHKVQVSHKHAQVLQDLLSQASNSSMTYNELAVTYDLVKKGALEMLSDIERIKASIASKADETRICQQIVYAIGRSSSNGDTAIKTLSGSFVSFLNTSDLMINVIAAAHLQSASSYCGLDTKLEPVNIGSSQPWDLKAFLSQAYNYDLYLDPSVQTMSIMPLRGDRAALGETLKKAEDSAKLYIRKLEASFHSR